MLNADDAVAWWRDVMTSEKSNFFRVFNVDDVRNQNREVMDVDIDIAEKGSKMEFFAEAFIRDRLVGMVSNCLQVHQEKSKSKFFVRNKFKVTR